MSKNVYCGAGKTPKGKTDGTFEQCFKKGQIRMYGLNELTTQQKRKTTHVNKQKEKMNAAEKQRPAVLREYSKAVDDTSKIQKKEMMHLLLSTMQICISILNQKLKRLNNY